MNAVELAQQAMMQATRLLYTNTAKQKSAENVYGQAYSRLVQLGVAPKLRARMRP